MTEQVVSLERLAAQIAEKRPTCHFCNTVLRGSDIGHYGPHDGGYHMEGYDEKRWVYVTCHGCGYDWSLWKLESDLA